MSAHVKGEGAACSETEKSFESRKTGVAANEEIATPSTRGRRAGFTSYFFSQRKLPATRTIQTTVILKRGLSKPLGPVLREKKIALGQESRGSG